MKMECPICKQQVNYSISYIGDREIIEIYCDCFEETE